MSDISKKMLARLEKQGEVTAAEFKAMMPDAPDQTVFSRIRALERKGLIYESGRGCYSLGAKPVYKAKVSPRMLELNNLLVRYPAVYSLREAVLHKESLKDAIVVKALVSDAPLVVSDGLSASSLEKILVDLVADKEFFRMSDDALKKEYQRALEVYPINKNRLLRYAGRRGVTDKVKEQLAGVNQFRVETIGKIQKTLAKQPVLRAWLFGSWSRLEERPDSDIDLLVDFEKKARVSLLDHIGYQQDLEEISGKSVDMVTNGTLLPFADKTANIDKYIIYERIA